MFNNIKSSEGTEQKTDRKKKNLISSNCIWSKLCLRVFKISPGPLSLFMLKTQVNGLTWRALIPRVRGSWNIVCHLASLIFWPTQCLTHCSSEKLHIWSSWKGRDIHSSIFPHNQSFTKEEEESADAGELSSWISGRIFFFLYPPVDSWSDSYKTHPSRLSVCLSL